MALTATLHHLEIAVADTDRGVYQSLDLRAARHPSESIRYFLTRTIALCLFWEEGIAFSRGLSTTDEPAVWVREPDGRVLLWIDVGHPTAERLHRASKQAARVAVCTYSGVEAMQRAAAGERVFHGDQIEIVAVPSPLLDALEPHVERHCRWDLLHTGGQLYITAAGATFEGAVERAPLFPATG